MAKPVDSETLRREAERLITKSGELRRAAGELLEKARQLGGAAEQNPAPEIRVENQPGERNQISQPS